MFILFLFISLAAFVVLIVGLIKPSIIKSGLSRKKVVLIFGIGTIAAFILAMATNPVKERQEAQAPAATTSTSKPTQTPAATKQDAQKELDEIMQLATLGGLVKSYEFSDAASVVYIDKNWYTRTVQYKKDFIAKVGSLKKEIRGYQHLEVRDAYSDEKVAEITSFLGEIKVYK